MAKLPRKNQKVFGSLAGVNQIGKFGSLAAGSAATTTDPEQVQALANYLTGWYGAVVGLNAPAMQDMNGLCFLFAYQLAYMFQSGIPEWDPNTSYYVGSLVNDGIGNIYISKLDDNLNKPLTNSTYWKIPGSTVRTVTGDDTATIYDDMVRVNNLAGPQTETLPALASVPLGKEITIKRLSTSPYLVTVKGNGAELIDDSNTFFLNQAKDAVRVKSAGTGWDSI